jgi:hypothetical protein
MTAVLALTTLCGRPAHAQSARLTLQSQPGDYIGQGQNFDFTYTPANTTAVGDFFRADILTSQNVAGQPAYVRFVFGSPFSNNFTTLDFATDQLGIPLAVGTYLDAQRASFADPGHPGLDVTFRNRGSNTLIGSFTITDVAFSGTGLNTTIDRFAATFEQHSEGDPAALFGTFNYLSANATATVPAAVSEPSEWLAMGMAGTSVMGLMIRARRRRTSKSGTNLA